MGSSFRQDLNSGSGETPLEGHLRLALEHLETVCEITMDLAHDEDQTDNAVSSGALYGRLMLAAYIIETELPNQNNLCPSCRGMGVVKGDQDTVRCGICDGSGRIYESATQGKNDDNAE